MKQVDAWEIAVAALRLYFLQGNSQIEDVETFIEEQTIETLDAIREKGFTRMQGDTATLVRNAKTI